MYLELEDLLQIQKIYIGEHLYTIYKRQRKSHEKEQYNIHVEGEEREWQPLLFDECSTCQLRASSSTYIRMSQYKIILYIYS